MHGLMLVLIGDLCRSYAGTCDCFPSGDACFPQGKGAMGAGDLLMSFLGVVILSFGFRIWGQRRLMARHAPEILGATAASASFRRSLPQLQLRGPLAWRLVRWSTRRCCGTYPYVSIRFDTQHIA